MNPLLLVFIGIPALEIFFMIKIGVKIGALNTLLLIFLTAIIGVYFAKLEGLKTLRSGILTSYQNKVPLYEILSGASIAIAAMLLIIPGFFTDTVGFLLLIPFTVTSKFPVVPGSFDCATLTPLGNLEVINFSTASLKCRLQEMLAT